MSKFKGNKLCRDCPDCIAVIYGGGLTEKRVEKGWCDAYKVFTSEESCCQDIYNKYKGIDG